ncbi:replication initiator protein [Microvirus mar33]|uniref:Replication initiator protein n=1 Tax=Microvirus mar33 TaxID=2851167 RepID=A0A8F5RBT0_9VIRU|nr:replication initiator protein [Microvirus mar33]
MMAMRFLLAHSMTTFPALLPVTLPYIFLMTLTLPFAISLHFLPMPCFNPLPAVRSADDTNKVLVCKRGTFLAPTLIKGTGEYLEPFQVPCGHCPGCALDKANQWALRLCCEYETDTTWRDKCWFITLTYDDDHIPHTPNGLCTLRKKDVQDFIKRLRYHHLSWDIRYYVSGEYGSHTYRPHYHMIIFNLPIDDLQVYSRGENPLFTSRFIDGVWRNGSCKIGELTYQSCAYTARYTMKKIFNGNKYALQDLGIEPEFSLSSRRPAIGFRFLQSHYEEVLKYEKILVPPSGDNPPRNLPLPPYFLQKISQIDPLVVARIKSRRSQLRELSTITHTVLSGLTEDEYLKAVEENLLSRIKSLKRGLK